jgi:methylenetetrahydrofolate reductase (NADPH)
MKVIEHIDRAKEPLFSYEIVPPPRGRTIKDITDVVEQLVPLNAPWIDVTSHSSTAYYSEKADGTIQKRVVKKRPGTIGICGVIQNRFKIDTVAHLLCLGFSREETEDALIEMSFLGIHNVLALRGDVPNFQKQVRIDRTSNMHAADLVGQICDLRRGRYLEEMNETAPLDFGIGVAGYPEKHFEAPNLKVDVERLKKKVDAGADYVVTQIFFDNQKYFDFVALAREAGIKVPIIPGLKVLRSVEQLRSLPKSFYINIPEALSESILKDPQHAAAIGKEWCTKQTRELLEHGAQNIHYYIMNDSSLIVDIVKKFQKF